MLTSDDLIPIRAAAYGPQPTPLDWFALADAIEDLAPGDDLWESPSGVFQAADARWRNENAYTNPTCGSYVVEPLDEYTGCDTED